MKIILSFIIFLCSSYVIAFDSKVFLNNKESISREVTNNDLIKMNLWIKSGTHTEENLFRESSEFLEEILTEFLKKRNHCDLFLPQHFKTFAKEQNIIKEDKELFNFLVFLRYSNLIDDLFYKLLKQSITIDIDFENKKRIQPFKPKNINRRYSRIDDINELYEPFKRWPDEISSCTIQTYLKHINKLGLTSSVQRKQDLQKLNWIAYTSNIISLEVYNKLEILRKANISSWLITTTRYIDIVKNAKDKKAQIIEEKPNDEYSSTYVTRKSNITRRGKLYAVYNSTQVFLLSEIIERTAKRMDARYVELSFQFTDDPTGEREIYIFSPMEQYRISINMLKKEIAQLLRSETFRGVPFDYGDLIAASYETGLIKSEEIDQILEFEDFWNPSVPRWKTYFNYAFSLAGTATYYLPPPWNFLGAVGLIMTQIKMSDEPRADSDDNWNSII